MTEIDTLPFLVIYNVLEIARIRRGVIGDHISHTREDQEQALKSVFSMAPWLRSQRPILYHPMSQCLEIASDILETHTNLMEPLNGRIERSGRCPRIISAQEFSSGELFEFMGIRYIKIDGLLLSSIINDPLELKDYSFLVVAGYCVLDADFRQS